MTDNDIKKALEDYIKENEFEYFHSNTMGEYPLIRNALAYINRLEAENERLKTNQKNSKLIIQRLKKKILVAKAEAHKEFAELVKKELSLSKKECRKVLDNDGAFAIDKARKKVDNLLKEMEGEDK